MPKSKPSPLSSPAVMEKVRVDTEIRKYDQFRVTHLNRQHNIRWEVHHLPSDIAESSKTLKYLQADIATREAHDGEEFVTTGLA
jgi:hypothetical protein